MISPIEKYDRELGRDIISLEKYIAHDEERAKAEFQRYGCPKETAEKRKDGKHISFDYSACLGSDELLTALKELQELSVSVPFRVYLTLPNIVNSGWEADWRSVEVIAGDGRLPVSPIQAILVSRHLRSTRACISAPVVLD